MSGVPTPLRVLVVDDDTGSAEFAVVLLQELGHDAAAAYDGEMAIALVSAWRPSVVLIDLLLPGMDGFEIARRLRSNPDLRGVRLVALTGMSDDQSRDAACAAGFDAHVVKGTSVAEMLRALSGAVP